MNIALFFARFISIEFVEFMHENDHTNDKKNDIVEKLNSYGGSSSDDYDSQVTNLGYYQNFLMAVCCVYIGL